MIESGMPLEQVRANIKLTISGGQNEPRDAIAGAAASRALVGDIALPRLFDCLPGLQLDAEAAPVRFGGWAFRGPLSLPVRLAGLAPGPEPAMADKEVIAHRWEGR